MISTSVDLRGFQMPNTPTEQIKPAAVSRALELMQLLAKLLFENGQTTRRMVEVAAPTGETPGVLAMLFARWGALTLRVDDNMSSRYETFAAEPAGVDLHRVAGVMPIVDDLNAGIDIDSAQSALEAIARFPPASTLRFALNCARRCFSAALNRSTALSQPVIGNSFRSAKRQIAGRAARQPLGPLSLGAKHVNHNVG